MSLKVMEEEIRVLFPIQIEPEAIEIRAYQVGAKVLVIRSSDWRDRENESKFVWMVRDGKNRRGGYRYTQYRSLSNLIKCELFNTAEQAKLRQVVKDLRRK
jgi:hypothetical protein